MDAKKSKVFSPKLATTVIFALLVNLLVGVGSLSQVAADSITGTAIEVGVKPSSVYVDHAGVFAYVVNEATSISKINISTNAVVTTLNVSGAYRLVINASDTFAYVTNNSNKIFKLDLSNFSLVGTINISGSNVQTYEIALNSSGSTAYVTDINASKLYVIDTSGFTLTNTLALDGVTMPKTIIVDSGNQYAYIGTTSKIVKVNLSNLTIDLTISIRNALQSMYMNSDATKIFYRSSYSTNSLRKIDLQTGTEEGSFTADFNKFIVTRDGKSAYLVNKAELIKVNLSTMNESSRTSVASSFTGYLSALAFLDSTESTIYASIYAGDIFDSTNGKIVKFLLSSTLDSQIITFASLPAILNTSASFALTATSSSGLTVSFTSSTPTVCSVLAGVVTVVKAGECTINAEQAGGSGWASAAPVSQSFLILPAKPSGEIGVSINSGGIFTNTRSVKLDLVWPEYATGALISNDGGFLASKTSTIQLAASVDWTLSSSGSERLPKIVYIRFLKSTGDAVTLTDDIILDMTPPALTSATAVVSSSTAGSVSVLSVGAKSKNGIKLLVKASDANSGIGWIEVRTSSNSVAIKIRYAKPKNKSQTFNLKTTSKSIQVRVLDLAGNTSKWKTVKVR